MIESFDMFQLKRSISKCKSVWKYDYFQNWPSGLWSLIKLKFFNSYAFLWNKQIFVSSFLPIIVNKVEFVFFKKSFLLSSKITLFCWHYFRVPLSEYKQDKIKSKKRSFFFKIIWYYINLVVNSVWKDCSTVITKAVVNKK